MPAAPRLDRLRTLAGAARRDANLALGQLGLSQSGARLAEDAQRYWDDAGEDRWRNDSHWRSGTQFSGAQWDSVGQEHRVLFDRLARTVEPVEPAHILDWGCGGGANAVHFAPLAREYTGVDVNRATLQECERQVAQSSGTPFHPVLVDVDRPEAAVGRVVAPCHLFLCTYVLELVPTPEHGIRIMTTAHALLAPGGLAFVQIKYATRDWRTRTRRRSYRSAVSDTTYRIEDFWTATERIGFRPEAVTLVPRNELDERYAYYLLSKPREGGSSAG